MTPDPETAPDLAVVIPHYDDTRRLAACLADLAPQVDGGVEVVVADNGTPGGLGGATEALPGVSVITVAERGAAPARTAGAAATTAPVIAFLDADCRPAPDWIAAIRRAVADHGLAAAGTGAGAHVVLGGRIGVFDEGPGPRTGPQAFETVFAFDQADYVARKGFAVTANLIVPRAVWEATGPFRPGLSEDVDWCRRAVALGARLIYAPGIAVAHPTRGDWAALSGKWRRLTAEEFGLEGRERPLRWRAKALAMPLSALAHVPKVLGSGDLTPVEKGRALVTLGRIRLCRMAWMLAAARREGGGR